MTSKFGATIIPFGVVGEDDMCDVSTHYIYQDIAFMFKLLELCVT